MKFMPFESHMSFLFVIKYYGKWRRKWQLTPVFLPGKAHGQKSLVGYSPWSHNESDTTEHTQYNSLGTSLVVWWLRICLPMQEFSCVWLCNTTDCSMPGLPVHHQLPEFTQTHVHWVGDAIQPSHPLSSPSPALNLSQHQGLFINESVLHIGWPKSRRRGYNPWLGNRFHVPQGNGAHVL